MASLTLDWLHLVALLGAGQGVLLALTLLVRRRNRTANALLAVLMLAFSVHLATVVYHGAGLVPRFPHFFGVSYALPLLYGPLVWLYAVTAADRDRGFRARDLLHVLPFVAVIVAALPIYRLGGAEKVAFYERLVAGERPLLLVVVDQLKLVSGVLYAAATIVFLRRHRERVKESYSSTERVALRWLLWLGLAAAAVWGIAVAFQLLEATGVAKVGRGDDVISLALAVLVYAIGYRGLRQPEVFRYETAEHPVPGRLPPPPVVAAVESPTDSLADEPVPVAVADGPAAPRYERSGLTAREAKRLRDRLVAVMDGEQPWKDAELTLADLAERLATTPHKLSEVLNAQLCATFYDFVNGYRVREVQRRIVAGDAERLTILALALDAGFASKSTFNAVFRKHTGRTPSEFRESGVRAMV
jgi:AraC-like DNA-binding protein